MVVVFRSETEASGSPSLSDALGMKDIKSGDGDASVNALRVLVVLGGAVFIAAGLVAFFGGELRIVAPLVLVVAGVAVILATRTKIEKGPWDVAILAVSLLVLASTTAGFVGVPAGSVVYSASSDKISATSIDLAVSTNMGSVNVSFSDNASLGYRVEFLHPSGFFGTGQYSFKDSTVNGVLHLDAEAQTYSVDVVVGRQFQTNVNASSDLGSISFRASDNHGLGRVQLAAALGSVNLVVQNSTIGSLLVTTSTGSVNAEIDRPLAMPALSAPVQVRLNAGTGSARLSMNVGHELAVSLGVSTGTGSISQNLQGFTVQKNTSNNLEAVAGNPAAGQSLDVEVTVSTGSANVSGIWG